MAPQLEDQQIFSCPLLHVLNLVQKKQTAPNVIPLGQFKFDSENRAEIERVIPDGFITMMEKKLVYLRNIKYELDIQMPLDMKMMWQLMGLYRIKGSICTKL